MCKHGIRFALCLVVLVAVPALSQAAQYWVSPSGRDTAAGTKAKPFRTITRAAAAVRPGDTVLVKAGRYEECVAIGAAQSGVPGRWVTFSAAPGDERKVVVGIEKPRIDVGGRASSPFGLTNAHYVRLRGFKCVSAYRGSGSGISASKSDHLEILDCIATGGGQGGMDLNECDFLTVDGCEIYFNGGGMAWSSGISIWLPQSRNNVIRNCVLYGTYDSSAYRTDGNGIIIDGMSPAGGGCLMVNNLAFMNGGKGICSTRCDNCTFINNTSVANCWQPNQHEGEVANEYNVRGASNLLRNNIGVSAFPGGVGLVVLPFYTGSRRFDIETILCDHNLFHSATGPAGVAVLGEETTRLTLAEIRQQYPYWADGSLDVDPGFVDMKDLDFRLRPNSPALKAGVAAPEAPTDVTGKPRPRTGAVSMGCYEGAYKGAAEPRPTPGVVIAPGQDQGAIRALLTNQYDLDWHGMLWGWGKLLTEELPLQADVQGPRRKDFLNLTGRFVLKDVLYQIAREHQVRLVLSQPKECRGIGTGANVISNRLIIREGAGAEELAFVREMLRSYMWTSSDPGISFASVLPALSAALGMKIESNPPIPADREFVMLTRNMRLSAFLTDLADRMDLKLTLSREDPLANSAEVQTVEADTPFGGPNGVVSVALGESGGGGRDSRIELFARVQPKSALRARAGTGESYLSSPAGIDDRGPGSFNQSAYTRLVPGTTVRLAVMGQGCALNVSGEWVMLNRVPSELTSGSFYVRSASGLTKAGGMHYVPLDAPMPVRRNTLN